MFIIVPNHRYECNNVLFISVGITDLYACVVTIGVQQYGKYNVKAMSLKAIRLSHIN